MHSVITDISRESVLDEVKKYSYLNRSISLLNRLIVLLSSSIVVLSDNQYKILRSYSKKANLQFIHHGIDILNLRRESHLSFNFSYIGMIRPNKGVHILLEAFQKLSQRYKNIQLIIAGSVDDSPFNEYESYFKNIKSKIKNMQQICNVKFYEGWMEDKDILELLKIVDVMVFPYIDNANEISGAAFSYSSLGIPYICSDIPRFSSSFADNETAVFFQCCSPNQLIIAMEKLMNDSDLRTKLSENLENMSKEYNWEENSLAYYRLYCSLVK